MAVNAKVFASDGCAVRTHALLDRNFVHNGAEIATETERVQTGVLCTRWDGGESDLLSLIPARRRLNPQYTASLRRNIPTRVRLETAGMTVLETHHTMHPLRCNHHSS